MRNPIIIIIMLVFSYSLLRSELDTLGIVILKDPIKTNANTLEFSLCIKNTSDKWSWWANGSFQLELALDIDKTNAENFDFILNNDDSEFNTLPDNYLQILSITENSFLVNILGPDEIGDCVYIPQDSTILLGKYRIISKNNISFADSLQWKKPVNIWQSCAYKADKDSIVGTDLVWFRENDNIELTDRHNTTICDYIIEQISPPQFILKDFRVEYIGSGITAIQWETKSEAYNKGFSLLRVSSYYSSNEYDEINTVKIADYKSDLRLAGCENYEGRSYPTVFDTLPQHDVSYKYILEYTDYFDDLHRIDSAEIFYPRSIISYAQSNPNPFIDRTAVDFIAEDDVIINAAIYDIKGKEVLQIYENELMKKGRHQIMIGSDQLHSSGVYELIILAHSVNSRDNYISEVVVPIHLLN